MNRNVEISEAPNGPGRKELTAEEIIKKQQQRFKEVEEKKEALKADGGNFENNNDRYLETPKNAQRLHSIQQKVKTYGRRKTYSLQLGEVYKHKWKSH